MIQVKNCTPKRSYRFSTRIENEKIILTDEIRNETIRLNPLAAQIWKLADGLTSITEIQEHCEDYFKHEQPNIDQVLSLIEALKQQKLLFVGADISL